MCMCIYIYAYIYIYVDYMRCRVAGKRDAEGSTYADSIRF